MVVADSYNHRLKIVDVAGSSIKTIGGNGKPGYRDGKGKYVAFFGGLDSRMCTPDPSLTYSFVCSDVPEPMFTLRFACRQAPGSSSGSPGDWRPQLTGRWSTWLTPTTMPSARWISLPMRCVDFNVFSQKLDGDAVLIMWALRQVTTLKVKDAPSTSEEGTQKQRSILNRRRAR